jgi:CHAT domain-containing protein
VDGLVGIRPRRAVLSACESAVLGEDLPDELVSLATGLLQAGAGAVLATLWPVDDAATVALVARFYQLWRDHAVEPADALRRAQLWVRGTTNGQKLRAFPELGRLDDFAAVPGSSPSRRLAWENRRDHEHPSYWAPFVYLGR